VDCRVNSATVQRDFYLKRDQERIEAKRTQEEPTQFLHWQKEMNDRDDENRAQLILERHLDLDFVRRRAKKAKKIRTDQCLADGKELRDELSTKLGQTKEEIEAERQAVIDYKHTHPDQAPNAVSKYHRGILMQAREFRGELVGELRSARRRRDAMLDERRRNAAKIRSDAVNHTNLHADAFISKQEITKTRFLMELTDEETEELIEQNRKANYAVVETRLKQNRKGREDSLEHIYEMLEEVTEDRDVRNEAHMRRRAEAKAAELRSEKERERREADGILKLEKKREKQRLARLREAEEMDEHMRAIAARNRYLALGKKAVEERGFESLQDGRVRSAKERQDEKAADNLGALSARRKRKPELSNLKVMLGLS
jgi:hypothetical protein